MRYIITEVLEENINKGLEKNAGGKARNDIRKIFLDSGAKEIIITVKENIRAQLSIINKIKAHLNVKNNWINACQGLGKGDYLYVQYPIRDHTVFCGSICKYLSERGVKVILLIHDLNILRDSKHNISWKRKIRYYFEEKTMLENCSYIIAHNEQMMKALKNQGINKEKMVSLEIFDYIVSNKSEIQKENSHSDRLNNIVIAGNLDKQKAGYVYMLPEDDTVWNIYGVNYSGTDNEHVHYKGAYMPEDLPNVLIGDYGLVWDGDSAETCSGVYGDYLRINNPHKTSLYLAAGLPVIIWKDAALAQFIERHHCGIVVASLGEINKVIKKLSKSEYESYKLAAEQIGKKIREGNYTLRAIKTIESKQSTVK